MDAMNRDGNNCEAVSRRRILRSTGIAGSIAVSSNLVGSAKAEKTVEIITHIIGDEENEITKKVPRSWKEHSDRVSLVREQVQNEYIRQKGVESVSIGLGNEYFGGKRGFSINVGVDSEELNVSPNAVTPDTIDGVELNVEEEPEEVEESCDDKCWNSSTFDPTPGGVLFAGATAGARFFAHGIRGNDYMITAAHNVDLDYCDKDLVGSEVEQHCNYWGEVMEQYNALDIVMVSLDSDYSMNGEIEQHPSPVDVSGYVTLNGLKDLESDGETVYKMGCRTGMTSGPILETEVSRSSCPTFQSEGIEIELDSAAGDSGCPYYDLRNGGAYLIGFHSRGVNTTSEEICNRYVTSRVRGSTAYYIADEYSGYFD
ncbi:hypothetical protein [Natrialba sp. INN-245]|uniref:hypothetical protein n=1 Tax=Natrialba sp. INN-245 TaxID=2690967 RepID=UPI00131163A4|nr:hypothetical protein [Natrialba sp. INN-245]MWV38619.1 hypothetical protein [Natrialba sp. INN-245]